jgi:hypothetical protein
MSGVEAASYHGYFNPVPRMVSQSADSLPLGVTGNTPDSGSGESWFDPRRGNSKPGNDLRSLPGFRFRGLGTEEPPIAHSSSPRPPENYWEAPGKRIVRPSPHRARASQPCSRQSLCRGESGRTALDSDCRRGGSSRDPTIRTARSVDSCRDPRARRLPTRYHAAARRGRCAEGGPQGDPVSAPIYAGEVGFELA